MPTADHVARPTLASRLPAPPTPGWWSEFLAGPGWLRAGAAALVAYTVFVLTPQGAAATGSAGDVVANAARNALEGVAFLWAAGRPGLPRRLRWALHIFGVAGVGTALNYLLLVPPTLGGAAWLSQSTDTWLTLVTYLGTLAALLVYPRRAVRPGETLSVALDGAVTVGGVGLLAWTFVTQPSQSLAADAATEASIAVFGVVQLALIAGLNAVVVRGAAIPSRRAFWCIVGGQACYLPVVVLAQLREAQIIAAWPADVVYYLSVVPTLIGASLVRADPLRPTRDGAGPSWLRDLNPLPLAMPILLGVGLLAILAAGDTRRAWPLALMLAAVGVLQSLRLLLSARQTAAVARGEAAREQRRQAERLQAVGRLAGGVAHRFNNLMMRVMGHADLGAAAVAPDSTAATAFVRIRDAAQQAAAVTSQLLAFSGGQRTRLELIDVSEIVREFAADYGSALPPGVALEPMGDAGPCRVMADAPQLRNALACLVDNACEAVAGGGHIGIQVRRCEVEQRLPSTWLPVAPGRYVVVAVADTGVGMTPTVAAAAREPFYSTKPTHLAAGLGLSVVHGFVASHDGGLTVESQHGQGTTVSLYLRAAE